MKAYELRFLNAQGATLLAYMDEFADEAEAMKILTSLRAISCERMELWCDDEMVFQERRASTDKPSAAA